MVEFTPQQMQMIERLLEAGFRPLTVPLYENAICLRRGDCAAVLAPVPNGGLKLLAPATYLVGGNLGVRLKRGDGEAFVWKKHEVAATPARLQELEKFRAELAENLGLPATQ